MLKSVIRDLKALKNPQKITVFKRFFKTGKDEYGEGDQFLGLTVPQQREIAKKYWDQLTLADLTKLLRNSFHECRLTALFIAILQYQKYKKEPMKQKRLVDWYIRNTSHINNWDLVDSSAPNILGDWLLTRSKTILFTLVQSDSLWERRIAVLASYTFIRNNHFDETIRIATMLLRDTEDLIHKAVGWMLREIGKRDMKVEESFLKQHMGTMPRTMLRYAIERFPENKRKIYLEKN